MEGLYTIGLQVPVDDLIIDSKEYLVGLIVPGAKACELRLTVFILGRDFRKCSGNQGIMAVGVHQRQHFHTTDGHANELGIGIKNSIDSKALFFKGCTTVFRD